jgi:tRNA dimethylallyltransferase
MTGLGYRQIGAYLRGETDLYPAIELIKRGTRRFVQQQYNWFPLDDPAIHWFDPGVEAEASTVWSALHTFDARGKSCTMGHR